MITERSKSPAPLRGYNSRKLSELEPLDDMIGIAGCGFWNNMNSVITNTELSSLEGTRGQFNGSRAIIKLGIDVHQDYYTVVKQEGETNPANMGSAY